MKTPTINIYISEKNKAQMLKYCGTHHVSFSTFIEKLVYATSEIQKDIIDHYFYTNKDRQRTSVKVNSNWDADIHQKSMLYSNLIYLYFNKKLKDYYTTERYQRIMQIFQNEIDKSTDEYWNYNNHIRNEARMLKNKRTREYLQRKLDQYENHKS